MNLRFYVVLFSCLFLGVGARCQKVAVKSNLLYDATATINLGIEFCLAPKWTFDVSGNYNGWTFSGIVSGSIALCSRRPVIGFVTVFLGIFWVAIF